MGCVAVGAIGYSCLFVVRLLNWINQQTNADMVRYAKGALCRQDFACLFCGEFIFIVQHFRCSDLFARAHVCLHAGGVLRNTLYLEMSLCMSTDLDAMVTNFVPVCLLRLWMFFILSN